MPNKINFDIQDLESEIRDMIAPFSSGQRGTITLDFMVDENNDKVFSASIEGVKDVSTPAGPEGSPSGGFGGPEDLPPPALVVITGRGSGEEEA